MNGRQEPLVLKGTNKTLYIEGQMLRFKYGVKDLFFGSKELRGSKEFHLSDVTSVQHKKSDLTGSGFIQFTLDGGRDLVSSRDGAKEDENTIVYISPFKNDLAEEIVNYIRNFKNDSHNGNYNNNYGRENGDRSPEAQEHTLREEAAALDFKKEETKKKNPQIEILNKQFSEGNITEEEFIRMLKVFTD